MALSMQRLYSQGQKPVPVPGMFLSDPWVSYLVKKLESLGDMFKPVWHSVLKWSSHGQITQTSVKWETSPSVDSYRLRVRSPVEFICQQILQFTVIAIKITITKSH